jgi:deazaflavin-dependent oxidoreductase (nitroreductase family)
MTYQEPGWFTRHVLNTSVQALTRLGISVWGSRVLEHRGRTTGQVRTTPVNLLGLDGQVYLVAARGTTQWVRNVRADEGRLGLAVGRRRTAYVATELQGAEAVPVLRAYLRRWKAEVGAFFAGVGPDASDAELLAIVAQHPVFRLAPAA